MISATRGLLRRHLVEYGEDAAAEWVVSCTDDELLRLGSIAYWVSLKGPSTPSGASMMIGKALAIGAVCVHEGKPRKLARARRRKLPELSEEERRRIRSEPYPMAASFEIPREYGMTDEIKEFWADPGPAR
ncbi:hypothetical protein ATK30_2123 [Amycolatopsis echigonensis]|uniref:Uncharacterized protein n=1 Tax=Amycolatopsis echigonensis TaxID=2576905 RepID=A0A2N3WBT4_9PSEU|nr:hypothetical protein [Amycolatopsis niigatensis]PKV91354.1 hypothetical protein ATK30_2123 [Amycolatopsis niigatensis]